MKTIKVTELKDGMRFTQPVFFEGGNVLVPADLPVKQKDIDRLLKWEIEEVSTEGEIKKKESAEVKGESYSDMLRSQADTALLSLYTAAVERLNQVFSSVRDGNSVNTEQIDKTVAELMNSIRDKKDEMISFIILSGFGDKSLSISSVNAALISIFIAQTMKFPSHRLIQLAAAALLHDIGMMKIPEGVTKKGAKLTEEEFKLIRTHVLYSQRIITKILKYPEEVGLIALQHHERWDGNGYPNRLAGEKINQASRILSVADSFEAMVSVRPYRNSMIGYKAMRELLNDNSRRFDSEILKIFIKIMGIYPIGSIVLLNDASIGRVISIHSDAPLRPIVKIMVNAKGHKVKDDAPVIDLLTEKSLFISRAINPGEIHGGKSE